MSVFLSPLRRGIERIGKGDLNHSLHLKTGDEIEILAEEFNEMAAHVIAINSVGLSKELLESELFGHEQGSFTGAYRRKTGKIELAHGGTIFFDEIGDVSQELQAKLLRFCKNGNLNEWEESPLFPLMSGS
jgi:transcriptional regulator with GAF, ATPase, and Fis domain